MRRLLSPVLTVVISAASVLPGFAQTGDEGTVSLAERVWMASKIYSSVQMYFAHWEGVPELDLEAVYRRYLDQATASAERKVFDLATMEFFAQLRNGHSDFNDPWLWQRYGQQLGFSLHRLDGVWIVDQSRLSSPAVGDVVERIEGVPADEFLADLLRYVSASSDEARRTKLFWRPFLFPAEFTLSLADGRDVIIRRGRQDYATAPRREMESRLLTDDVPYLYIPSFGDPANEEAAVEFLRQQAEAPALIIDVRGNGGGTTPVDLIRGLMDRPYRDWTESTALSIALFGAYRRVAESSQAEQLGDYVRGYLDAFANFNHPQLNLPGALNMPRGPVYEGELFLLADFGCASACEDFLLPFKQSGRALIIGQRTRGSTGQPYLYEFENGMSFRVSSKRVYFPDGLPFEGVGIVPDIVLTPSVDDVKAGRDIVLDRALELARQAKRDG
jgi:carboxyl-terminal processing protease